MWPEDIRSNEASVAASLKDEAEHQTGAAHQLHADEFLRMAGPRGEDAKAGKLADQYGAIAQQMAAMPGMDDMKMSGPGRDNRLQPLYLRIDAGNDWCWRWAGGVDAGTRNGIEGFFSIRCVLGTGRGGGTLEGREAGGAGSCGL